MHSMNSILQKCPDIGDKIFLSLDNQSLLACQNLCKKWKTFFENPMFWVKVLIKLGQSIDTIEAWKRLIVKDRGLHRKSYAKCLRKEFVMINEYYQSEEETFGIMTKEETINFHLKSPPLLTASQFGHLEIVKLIYKTEEDYNEEIFLNIWHLIGTASNCYVMPLFEAIHNNHTKVAKFILKTPQEEVNPSTSFEGDTPMSLAIRKKNLKLVKFLAPRLDDLDYQHHYRKESLIHLALEDYDIFKYLISVPGINPNLADMFNKTPLLKLCDIYDPVTKDFPHEQKFEMIKILAPMAKDTIFSQNITPLHYAANYIPTDILTFLMKYFNANVVDDSGFLPIDKAVLKGNVEAVKILASYTKKLKINRIITKRHLVSKSCEALKVMKSLIKERNLNGRIKTTNRRRLVWKKKMYWKWVLAKRKSTASNGKAKKKVRRL